MMEKVLERIESEVEDEESSPAEYEITTYPADFTLIGLYQQCQKRQIIFPTFQRKFVWTQVQASKLIESFLIGLPVPPIFLYRERKSEQLLVIDGQQRLKTIFYFFEGSFGEEFKGKKSVFRLKGLSEHSPWVNKTYKEIEETDEPSSRRLQNSVLRSFIVKQLNPQDDTSVYHIFERLNTGGTLLKNQEIRNCIYIGPFNNLLLRLNGTEEWRSIFGKESVDARMRDVELILRFFAIYYDFKNYVKPMKDFLSNFMGKHRSPSIQELETYENMFTSVAKRIVQTLGSKPFHIKAGLNAAVFDSVFVAVAQNINSIPETFHDKFNQLKRDNEFLELSSKATTDEATLKKRIACANRILFR